LQTSTALQAAMAALRTKVATLAQDRYMAPSIEAAADMIATGTLCGAVDLPPFVQGFAE
jgi:histidine ammonia-lyase